MEEFRWTPSSFRYKEYTSLLRTGSLLKGAITDGYNALVGRPSATQQLELKDSYPPLSGVLSSQNRLLKRSFENHI